MFIIEKLTVQRISKKKSAYQLVPCMTTTHGQHCSAPLRHRLNQSNFSHCFLVLFAIPVATFGGGSGMEVVAGAHVYPADPIGIQWDSSPAIWKTMEAH